MDQKPHQDLNDARKNEEHEEEEVAPGVPIIRSNTPRPLSFDALLSGGGQAHSSQLPPFPTNAPSAPPLPEEPAGREEETAVSAISSIPISNRPEMAIEDSREFIWLFEYGLEMDAAILNSPERLDGLALLYGPAVLKGYTVMFGAQRTYAGDGPTIVTVISSSNADAEVWGVLYRVPRRLTERDGDEPSLLDTIHAAIEPQNLFKDVQIVVHEVYRGRDITCITYAVTDTARPLLRLVPVEQWRGDALFTQRIAAIARKQKLPDRYVSLYEETQGLCSTSEQIPISSGFGQDTEPLPALKASGSVLSTATTPQETPRPGSSERYLIAFAIYLVLLLFLVLTFAVLQGLGFGSTLFTPTFMPLGVPWMVMVYGLLGGCISSIISLGKLRPTNSPLFTIIAWFTRPFVGAVLAGLTYLVLTSGFFIWGDGSGHHSAVFLLAGALAGLCERWLFVKRIELL